MQIDGYVVKETERAVSLRVYDQEYWFPKSQLGEGSDSDFPVGFEVTVFVPDWLAKEKGLA